MRHLAAHSGRRTEQAVAAFAVELAGQGDQDRQRPFDIQRVVSLSVWCADRERGSRGSGVESGEKLHLLNGDASDRLSLFGAERGDPIFELVETMRPSVDEFSVP